MTDSTCIFIKHSQDPVSRNKYTVGNTPDGICDKDLAFLFTDNIDVKTLDVGGIKLTNFENITPDVTLYNFEVTKNPSEDMHENTKPTCSFFHVTSSTNQDPCLNDVIKSIYRKLSGRADKMAVFLAHRNGYDDSLWYIVAGLNLIQILDEEDELDVYRVVFQLKSFQPQCFNSDKYYKKLYLLAEEHLTSTSPNSRRNCGLVVPSLRKTIWGPKNMARKDIPNLKNGAKGDKNDDGGGRQVVVGDNGGCGVGDDGDEDAVCYTSSSDVVLIQENVKSKNTKFQNSSNNNNNSSMLASTNNSKKVTDGGDAYHLYINF
ncbi:hypothetical protein HELRODRAFT_163143 [Helobdella robusta]|uniref:Uncharacterized protein n=1 Tax=Helobdella robusta TaxID=6412 RepID=T1ETQ1_HELRO|nr:hypothetical protein HELRODRAFT_163143 [Helobdella robusta]ESN96115.1 hypothetical protein HELRODRAFT_163143 [Helobdella robusta]